MLVDPPPKCWDLVGSSVVGCARANEAHVMKTTLPGMKIRGFDVNGRYDGAALRPLAPLSVPV
jgi:hypothetical protein